MEAQGPGFNSRHLHQASSKCFRLLLRLASPNKQRRKQSRKAWWLPGEAERASNFSEAGSTKNNSASHLNRKIGGAISVPVSFKWVSNGY